MTVAPGTRTPAGPAAQLGLRRVTDTPLLDQSAVPWCLDEPKPRPTIMFPTVVDTAPWDVPGLSRFHMYYAPHRSAGIGLATSDQPEGPWTPHVSNPIVKLSAFPGLSDHLSSPEIVHRPGNPRGPLWLYVHGRMGPRAAGFGQNTCVATSANGVTWRPLSPDPVLTATAEQSGHANSAAYARVFHRGDWLYALYKAETVHGLARSRDGLTWEHWPHNPILSPAPAAGDHAMIRHTGLLLRGDTLVIFYSPLPSPNPEKDGPGEQIKLATLDLSHPDWLQWGPPRRLGTVLSAALSWESGDVRDPYPLILEDTLYLYYVGGHEHGVGLARAPLASLAEALER
jgi:hypothetical protein